jgi:predicted O-methyltransferase YrrM
MEWTEGYASDVEYTSGFYQEQSPVFLNFACVLNGIEPVALDQPYTYFELGFGRGLTVNVLAAGNPLGRFYAADFNPAHVAGAQQLADAAGLDNLTLLENSFAELAEGKVAGLPQFDFITLHGIYTWVTAENRTHIINFISRYLKSGGIVFLSYNAMPGWSTALPLQRLLTEHAAVNPNRSDLQIRNAADFADRLNTVGAAYFSDTPSLKSRVDMLKTRDPQYLVHEYMHRHWQPLYHADVARDLATAKLEYAGSADLHFAYPALYLNPEKLALINGVSDPALRETLKDYMLNSMFRKDIFVRGARRMPTIRHAECLQQVGLMLLAPREHVKLQMKLTAIEIKVRDEIYNPVLDALAERPHTLAELHALPWVNKPSIGDMGQIAALLTASGQATIYDTGAGNINSRPALKMNYALAARTLYNDEYRVLVSPLAGSGIGVSYVDRLIYFLLVRQSQQIDVTAIARQAWNIMAQQGRRLMKGDKLLESEQEHVAELERLTNALLTLKIPRWRQWGMI